MFFKTLAAIVILAAFSSAALAESGQVIFDSIDFQGLERTQVDVLRREITYEEGQPVSKEEIAESLQRIRNTQLFASVRHEVVEEANVRSSKISVEERWTTIPIFKLNQGGGATQMTLGAYDINMFGKYVEGGAQVEKLGKTTSGVVWYRNPRFLGKRFSLEIDGWDSNRIRLLYGNRGEKTDVTGGFVHRRRKLAVRFGKEWSSHFKTHVVTERIDDRFTSDYIEPGNATPTDELPGATQSVLTGIDVKLGRLDHRSYLVDGWTWDQEIRHCEALQGDHNYRSYTTRLVAMKTVFKRMTLGMRMDAGLSNATSVQNQFYLGGLDAVRGFRDSRFRGTNYQLMNVESRLPVYESSHVVAQGVTFFDRGTTATDTMFSDAVGGSSVGVGARIIAPKIYRLVIRADFAYGINRSAGTPLSLGVQQYF